MEMQLFFKINEVGHKLNEGHTMEALKRAIVNASKPPMPFAQQMPIYPGGEMAMMNDLNEHLIYPPSEIENKIEGKVFIQFIIEKEGSISDLKIKKRNSRSSSI